MTAYVPPGWPSGVHPPGAERFEDTAVAWLFDLLPAEYRRYGVLRRYPVVLAHLARRHVTAALEGARDGFRTACAELSGSVPAHGIQAALDIYRQEGTRLAALARSAELVEAGLRGGVFTPGPGLPGRTPAPEPGRSRA